jgi:DNA-binding XRE family transcriptional regulator
MTKREQGRPTEYKPEYDELAYNYCLLGAIDDELASFFDVSKQTINAWKKKHPSFFDSIKKGKTQADAKVARSLFERACGYSHPEDKIFNDNGEPLIVHTIKHYPPDTGAGFIWLKNRQPDKWRDKPEGYGVAEPIRITITRATSGDQP